MISVHKTETQKESGDLAIDDRTRFGYKSEKHSHILNVIVFSILGILSRLYKISNGNTVVWDEAHFGKFASYYIRREFYADVHPPGGKMLVGLAGYLVGYNGTYEFTSGETYPDWVNYVGMRVILATIGGLAVPLMYMTSIHMGMSVYAAYIVAVCTLLDNGLIVVSKLVLLDPLLLFFTALSLYSLAFFIRHSHSRFSREWFRGLLMCGISIGCVISVKWIGLFTITLVGLYTIRELFQMLKQKPFPKHIFVLDFISRAFFLIVIPLAMYSMFFYIHFAILNRSGPGNSQMSSLFQAGLKGNVISENPYYVAYGSLISVKNYIYGGGILHSHTDVYPGGSGQQQVTCYHHNDTNNNFLVEYPHKKKPNHTDIRYLKDGDVLRLLHMNTNRNLHSHKVPAHINKKNNEVSAYGDKDKYPDENDHWRIEIVKELGSKDDQRRIRSLITLFRLRHVNTGCYLVGGDNHYPEWGHGQIEVSCNPNTKGGLENSLWNVEYHRNSKLPPGNLSLYKSSFWDNLVDCNVSMMKMNNGLISSSELEITAPSSRAIEWPFLYNGIRMTSFADNVTKFYMLGNPLVWCLGTCSLILIAVLIIVNILFLKREKRSILGNNTIQQIRIFFTGWALHYFPFYIMGRVLYMHHYHPALMFSIQCLGIVFEEVGRLHIFFHVEENKFKKTLCMSILIPIIYTFYLFMPICYGVVDYKSISHLKWVSSWNL